MADGGGGGGSGVTADDEDSKAAPNTFSNDGSFMEQFIKMQKEKEAESAKNKAPSSSNAQLVKKKAPTSLVQKMIKNRVAKKLAASAGKKNVGSNNDNNATKEEPDPSTTPSSSSLSSSTSSSSSSTITDTPSSSTITSPTPPPPTTTSLLSASAKKGGRKRKSKWDAGSSEPTDDSLAIHEAIGSFSSIPTPSSSSLSSSSMAATGGAGGGGSGGQNLTPDQLQQIREQIAMQKMVAEIKSATAQSTAAGTKQNRYEYDSDEDTDGGTWEHKTRLKEMRTSEDQAKELTEMGKGKHHIGDFLPPEEMEKFVETVNAVKGDRDPDLSDYKEHKLTEDNIGFKLLQKSGWDEGTGLGAQQQGITAPVNKGKQSFDQSGVGVVKPAEVKKSDDEFDLYRKRMMLAYRFRPNPLNNPRRPYY